MEGSGLLSELPKSIHQATSIQGRYSSLSLLIVGEQLCHCCGTGNDSFGLPLVHHLQIWWSGGDRLHTAGLSQHCMECLAQLSLGQASRRVCSDLFSCEEIEKTLKSTITPTSIHLRGLGCPFCRARKDQKATVVFLTCP